MSKSGERLNLSLSNWWHELEELENTIEFPRELTLLMRGVITATLNSVIPPTASASLIASAKEHLADGILLGDDTYDVMVCVPNDPEKDHALFTIVKTYSRGQLKRLSEL